jgi:hypothetical protein
MIRRPGVGDFHETGQVAAIFWRADLHPAVLPVQAESVDARNPDAVQLDCLPCPCIVRRAADDREELILGEGACCIRIAVRTGSLLAGPVRLRYDLSGFTDIEMRLRALRQFLALNRLGRMPSSLFPSEPRAQRWSMALQAWDGRRAGATQREIAIALFGSARVAEDWRTGDDMRKRLVRLLRTAERLVAGAGPDMLRRCN